MSDARAVPSLLERLVRATLRRVKRLFVAPPPEPRNKHLWSIGIYAGPSPLALGPVSRVANPVLTREQVTDVRAGFVADPFLVRDGATLWMFLELYNLARRKGELAAASSTDGAHWQYRQVVLREPFHLSYPQVFSWEGRWYLLPETHETQTVRLYEAVEFPLRWRLVHTLLTGGRFSDATLLRHDDRWWMFVDASPEGKHDTLALYWADDLRGAWTLHPQSPLVAGDNRTARPAGRILTHDGKLYRLAQDCRPAYGMRVLGFEITTLTTTAYAERAVDVGPYLTGSGAGWNADGMHQVDALQQPDGSWIAAVDGWRWATKREADRAD